jgi:hypothetical protein
LTKDLLKVFDNQEMPLSGELVIARCRNMLGEIASHRRRYVGIGETMPDRDRYFDAVEWKPPWSSDDLKVSAGSCRAVLESGADILKHDIADQRSIQNLAIARWHERAEPAETETRGGVPRRSDAPH